jgi:hypothetical protein
MPFTSKKEIPLTRTQWAKLSRKERAKISAKIERNMSPEERMQSRRREWERQEQRHQKRMAELRRPIIPFDWTKYNQEQAEKAKEQELIDKLALEMLDIGFKVLAAKFHPDKPTGSSETMRRLNEARSKAKKIHTASTKKARVPRSMADALADAFGDPPAPPAPIVPGVEEVVARYAEGRIRVTVNAALKVVYAEMPELEAHRGSPDQAVGRCIIACLTSLGFTKSGKSGWTFKRFSHAAESAPETVSPKHM